MTELDVVYPAQVYREAVAWAERVLPCTLACPDNPGLEHGPSCAAAQRDRVVDEVAKLILHRHAHPERRAERTIHPVIGALFAALPLPVPWGGPGDAPANEVFPTTERLAWLRTMAAAFDMAYTPDPAGAIQVAAPNYED